jgi:hypothetical protein
MEYPLEVYHGPYDPNIPDICMDESNMGCGYRVITKLVVRAPDDLQKIAHEQGLLFLFPSSILSNCVG